MLPVGKMRIVRVIPIPGRIGADAGHAYKQVTVSHHLGEHERWDLLEMQGRFSPEPPKLPWKRYPERSRFLLVRLRCLQPDELDTARADGEIDAMRGSGFVAAVLRFWRFHVELRLQVVLSEIQRRRIVRIPRAHHIKFPAPLPAKRSELVL